MEQAIKQRLVGAAVLAALAVITLPIIFDAERRPAVQVPETIPPRPEWPAIATPEPQTVPRPADAPAAPVSVAEMYQLAGDEAASLADVPAEPTQPPPAPAAADLAVATDTATAVAKTEGIPPAPVLPSMPIGGKLDAHGVPESWVVQVAAMSDATKAEALIAKLKLGGYPAFKTVTRHDKGETIRVFVGPKLDKAQAARIKQQLDRELGEQTMVKPFTPQ